MDEKGGTERRKLKYYGFEIFLLIFVIVMTSSIIIYDTWIKEEQSDEKKFVCGGYIPASEFEVILNETVNKYEIFFQPSIRFDGKTPEIINISIEINNTEYYNFTDSNGWVKIHIPINRVNVKDLNSSQIMTIKAEGYEEKRVRTFLKYE